MRRKRLPGWFPFALIASGMLAVGAGIKASRKATAAAPPPGPNPLPPAPPLSQAGVYIPMNSIMDRGGVFS